MAANKRKILENARKLAQKGSKDKALKEYQKLVKLDPKDAKLRLEIGDAHRRWGQVEEAIDTYSKVADQYTKEGFDARAVAVYKQILNLDPERFESYPPLAELYERMGLTAEAIGALQTAADGYHRDGRKKEALDLLRRMATIDPSNTTSRIKVAELLRQEGMNEEAIAEYDEVATELTRQGDAEAAGKIYRRILEMEPKHVEVLVAFARNLLAQKMETEAETVAKRALAVDDRNPDHYELLAEVYRAQGRDELLPEVYRPLADLYRERGDEDRARELLQRFVPPDAIGSDTDSGVVFDSDPVQFDAGGDPDDELSLDDSTFGGMGSVGDGAAELELGPELELDGDGPLELSDAVGGPGEDSGLDFDDGDAFDLSGDDSVAVGADATISSLDPEGPVASQADKPAPITGDPDQLLAEASVYLRYGKRERAIAHLEAILQQKPTHRSALEKLGEAYAEDGAGERAVSYWLEAAKQAQHEGDSGAVGVLRGRIEALDPTAAASLPTAASEPEPAPEPDPVLDDVPDLSLGDSAPGEDLSEESDAGVEVGGDSDFELDIDLDDDPEISASDLADAESPEVSVPPAAAKREVSAGSDASLSTTTAQQIQEDLEEADFYMEQGLHNEAEEIYQRVLALAPNHPKALLRLGEVAAARGEDPGAKAGRPAAKPPAQAAAKPAPIAAQPDPEPELEESEIDLDLDDEPSLDLTGDDEPSFDLAGDDEPSLDLTADDEPEALSPEPEPDPVPEPESIELEDPGDASLGLSADLSADLAVDAEDEDPVDRDTGVGVEAEGPPPPEEETGEFSVPTEAPVKRSPPPPPAGAEAGFDLAAELSDVFDDDNEASGSARDGDDGFAAVFEAFKRGVSQTLSEADHEAHYDLGIAYKEMDLYDDAIQEFRAAMVHPPRVIECLHMIALCALDAGQHPLAVEHLEQLLESEGANDEQMLAARLDLGRAHEAMGAVAEARVAYELVAAVDASFQGVSERLAGLPEGKPDPATAQGGSEGFESFDDVMSEVSEEEQPQADAGESFDDLLAEVGDDADDDGDSDEDADGDTTAEAEAVIELETEPEPEPAAKASRKPTPAKKKRKKISFL